MKTKILVIGLALMIFSSVAFAQVVCNQIGNYTYCNDYSTGARSTCNRVGNYTYCN